MNFVVRCTDGKKILYKKMNADSVKDALFILRVKYPELDIRREDMYINADELKVWFSERGVFL